MNGKYTDALCKEALFTGEMLCAGYTQIRKANYASRGIYFQAFTSLSTGFERIEKLCYLLIYSIEHDGIFPTDKKMKNEIGHDIVKLYKRILDFKNKNNIEYDFLQDLDKPIYQSILKIISRFGKGDRYANLDLLVENINYEDPISVWYRDVDLRIYKEKIPEKKRKNIEMNATLMSALTSDFVMIAHTGEDGTEINEVFEGSFRTGLNEAVAPYRQLYLFHIIRFFVESLHKIECIVRREQLFKVPYFMDIFRVFYNEDSYFKNRKTIHLI